VIARNIFAVVLVASVSASAGAQTLTQPDMPPDARQQVDLFSASLRAAVVNAGRQLATRAQQVVPDIVLRFEQDPAVLGTWMPRGEGAVFVVDVPAIEATSAQLWDVYRRLGRPVGNGTVAPPPPPPVVDPVIPPMTSPEQEYSEFTRQALVEAMLQNAFALPL
jgi:hypothetical protein